MNTDRELLELAAKAAGLDLVWDFDEHMEGPCTVDEDGFPNFWNPLDDDGDALRLAVKLRLLVHVASAYVEVRWWDDVKSETHGVREWDHGDDPYAATRRAIVRMAAEIGKPQP